MQPLRAAYRALVEHLRADAVVLVDGGTDILMRGDEAGLGTPVEDMTSLAAVAGLPDIPVRLVACLGFGIDAYHGVNHVQVLENIAALAGQHGNVRFTSRTAGSTLFVNPLMAMYFTFELSGVADQNLYLDRIENTIGMRQVASRIEEFRDKVTTRIPRVYPH